MSSNCTHVHALQISGSMEMCARAIEVIIRHVVVLRASESLSTVQSFWVPTPAYAPLLYMRILPPAHKHETWHYASARCDCTHARCFSCKRRLPAPSMCHQMHVHYKPVSAFKRLRQCFQQSLAAAKAQAALC